MVIGSSASPGIAIGKALCLKEEELKIEKKEVQSVEAEINRFKEAVNKFKNELTKVRDKAFNELGEEKAAIFDAHIMLLEDPELISSTINKIETDLINSEYAFKSIIDEFIIIFESMDNEYMRERAADIKDVSNRVLRNLLGIKVIDLSMLEEEIILVSNDLTPSETATMDKDKVIGFLTNVGGRTSHTAIMARCLEIPAVVGLKDITEKVSDKDFLIIDGEKGIVIINPSDTEVKEYKELQKEYLENKRELEVLIGKKSITLDGRKVELAANIGTPNEVNDVIKNDGEGVGLFRTEFIYMNRDTMPSEEEQFNSYKEVLERLNSKPVVIRTLDIGGDKKLSYMDIGEEMNPFLGYRAIRLCLDQKDIFKTQLRALLRVSIYGNLRIMFPMISSLEELLEAKEVLNDVKVDLDKKGIEYSDNIEVGLMIEVPSAAIISDILAKHVDFFSIGTNDLIQYTTAVDRMNEKIQNLYNPFNPAVLRLIKIVIDNGHKEGKWVGMCGEMAGDSNMIPILLGLGLDEFSMSAISILTARKLINNTKYEYAKKIAEDVLKLDTANEIKSYMEKNFE